jgi:pilus assembly protein CpaE
LKTFQKASTTTNISPKIKEVSMTIRILVVDDNEITLKLVTATLSIEGFEIHTANSAKEAIEKVGGIKPQMAILDVMMPDMDGYELCKQLRHIPVTSHIPIMMLTAFSEISEKLKAFDAGADDFMPKPFQPQELQARVKVHLRRSISQTTVSSPSSSAKKIAVFSLRGGVGVSTLATNLAAGFTQL